MNFETQPLVTEDFSPTKTLIFDDYVFGHHLEYLHHLYERARALKQRKFVFAVPEDFKSASKRLEWPPTENISFYFFDGKKKLSSLARSQFVGALAKKYDVAEIFLISLMPFLPWLPLFVPARVRVSGIVYMIYLYRWKRSNISTRVLDVLKYLLLSRCRVFFRVFLLNDHAAPRYLNAKFRTKKFRYLPDPVAIPTDLRSANVREELGIPTEARIFSHLGAPDRRKGTFDLLCAAGKDCGENAVFVFAGRVLGEIRPPFFSEVEKLRNNGRKIFVFDKYCEYDFFLGLCAASDAVVLPYKNTDQSSGVIAYAAAARTPVVAPGTGLLGKLIRRYRLGVALKKNTPEEIAEVLRERRYKNISLRSNDYLRSNSLSTFQTAVFEK